MSLTHQDIKRGDEVEVSLGRAHDEGGWFKATVRKVFSRGTQVLIHDGPFRDKEISVKMSQVRLAPAPVKRPPPEKPMVVPTHKQKLEKVEIAPSHREPEPDRAPQPENEEIESQIRAWKQMGDDLLKPMLEKHRSLLTELEAINDSIEMLTEYRNSLTSEVNRSNALMDDVKKRLGR